MLSEKEFFDQIKGKGYSSFHMNNPYIGQMRSDRTWIIDRKTKQTIGHYMNSHYCGKGDFTIYKTPLEFIEKEKVKSKPKTSANFTNSDYEFKPLSLETIEEYVRAIFNRKQDNHVT